jgi:hypothetical protein
MTSEPRPQRRVFASLDLSRNLARLRPHAAVVVPGAVGIALMLVWAVENGGYDTTTWMWGALVLLGVVAAVQLVTWGTRPALSRLSFIALTCLVLYVAWSYLSILWAGSPGDALQGSNRALLYLLIFILFVALPWAPVTATLAMLAFALGIGAIGIVILSRLAGAANVQQLIEQGRLLSPTGYFNSTVALFMMGALLAVALATRRELPGVLRGVLFAFASAMLQLALLGESRGWLFTLPFVVIATLTVVKDRLRFAAAAVLPIATTLLALHRLLAVYSAGGTAALDHAARNAGHMSLLLCAATFFVGTLIAWTDSLFGPGRVSRTRQRQLGVALATIAVAGTCAGAVIATHGHPFRFADRQLRGFAHTSTQSSSSNFGVVGSGRFDFWRVSLDAFASHPLGGLGQDNFADYYVKRRHTGEEPSWTHSLEMRLLAHTGIVGFALFAAFLLAAIGAGLRTRRRGSDGAQFLAGAALLPAVVWVIHGSVDWFWEIPALSGPAFGFLAIAGALDRPRPADAGATAARSKIPRALAFASGLCAFAAAVVVLGFPYLSAREVALAGQVRPNDPSQAMRDLSRAADLNPLSALPGRLGGTIALESGQFTEAERRFSQATAREPGGWFSWLGRGLAASALGDRAGARDDFMVAASINSRQPAVVAALKRVDTRNPLTSTEAFKLLLVAQ